MKKNKILSPAAVLVGLTVTATSLQAATPVWFDGFDVTTNSSNINFETSTRQGGPLVPISYVANTADPSNDYHHQMFGPGSAPLQLAGDGNLISTLVSPNFNFVGALGPEILGRQIDVSIDAGVFSNGGAGVFTQAAITVGSTTTLQGSASGNGFSVVFVEDTFGGNGNFIQIYNNGALIDNLIANPAGSGTGAVSIFINDLVDGNPWDGINDATIGVTVNSTPIGSYNVGSGYTNNYITLEGSWAAGTSSLDTHVFDNLTVYSEVPEPSSAALFGVMGMLALIRRRRI